MTALTTRSSTMKRKLSNASHGGVGIGHGEQSGAFHVQTAYPFSPPGSGKPMPLHTTAKGCLGPVGFELIQRDNSSAQTAANTRSRSQ